jgi:hypothetical protein
VNRDPSSKAVVVTILGREAGETFEVLPELDLELQESIAQAERGEAIPVAAVLERLLHIA